jgi:hypothetical protein
VQKLSRVWAAEDIAFEWSEIGPLAGRNKLKFAMWLEKPNGWLSAKEEFFHRLGHRPAVDAKATDVGEF